MKPFLKWAGGKFRLVDTLKEHFPQGKRFVEPFFGSGAVSLNVDYPDYFANDANGQLVDFWIALRNEGPIFIAKCEALFADENNTKDRYFEIRQAFNFGQMGPEAFLYLNRHGFNGLCRYNKSGLFNVPYGRYDHPYFPRKELEAAMELAKKMTLTCGDFIEVFDQVREGDVVYCDPPYVPLSPTASFTSYSKGGFGMVQQLCLARMATAASYENGATVIISNHDTDITRDLYKDADEIHTLDVQRNISCNGAKRGKAKELIAVYRP